MIPCKSDAPDAHPISDAAQAFVACGFSGTEVNGLIAEGGALWLRAKQDGAKWCDEHRRIEFPDGSQILFVRDHSSLLSTRYEVHPGLLS